MMLDNKKAQVGPIAAIMLFGVFLVMWFVWLGSWVGEVGQMAVSTNGLTGIEAFFFNNLNFFIFIFMIVAMMGFMYFTS